MDKIILDDIRLQSNHGCLAEESVIGAEYRIKLEVWADLSKAAQSDDLADTVDYVQLTELSSAAVLERSALLEHAAKRAVDAIHAKIRQIKRTRLTLSKINPPINGQVAKVSVVIDQKS